jgi:hypothetical protein
MPTLGQYELLQTGGGYVFEPTAMGFGTGEIAIFPANRHSCVPATRYGNPPEYATVEVEYQGLTPTGEFSYLQYSAEFYAPECIWLCRLVDE